MRLLYIEIAFDSDASGRWEVWTIRIWNWNTCAGADSARNCVRNTVKHWVTASVPRSVFSARKSTRRMHNCNCWNNSQHSRNQTCSASWQWLNKPNPTLCVANSMRSMSRAIDKSFPSSRSSMPTPIAKSRQKTWNGLLETGTVQIYVATSWERFTGREIILLIAKRTVYPEDNVCRFIGRDNIHSLQSGCVTLVSWQMGEKHHRRQKTNYQTLSHTMCHKDYQFTTTLSL